MSTKALTPLPFGFPGRFRLKSLVLGETTSADTWVDREAVLQRLGNERPWWAPSEKKGYPIARLVQPGQRALIAVRVHDWYGAGGIYRPVTLGTQAFNPKLDLLK